jgi:hypothetical protein
MVLIISFFASDINAFEGVYTRHTFLDGFGAVSACSLHVAFVATGLTIDLFPEWGQCIETPTGHRYRAVRRRSG